MTTLSPAPLNKAVLAPGCLPLAGHLFQLARSRMDFLTSLNQYGSLVEVRMGTQRAYVVTDPELLHQMLVSEASSFDKGRIYKKVRRFVGNGLATAENATHRPHRKMLQPAFHRQRIAGYIDIMRGMAETTISQWQPGQVIALDKQIDELVTSMVAKVLFSSDLGHTAVDEIHRSLPILVRGVALRALVPTVLEWALPDNRQYSAAVKRTKNVIAEVIAGYQSEGVDHGDLLSMIIAARYENTNLPMNDQQIHDEVMTFLLGGVEATAPTVAWVFHELAQNPEIEEKLHKEVDSILSDDPLTYTTIPRLEYTNRVITESLRVYASTLLMRRVVKPITLGGVSLPIGAELIYSPYAIHRNPRWFPEPNRFDPDRWLPERAASIPRDAYVPFSDGAHTCIANSFAMAEMTLDVALIASKWQLRPVPGEQVRPVARSAVHPSQLNMICQPRA